MGLYDATNLGLTTAQLKPLDGWHCTHSFYRFKREAINDRSLGHDDFVAALTSADGDGPQRLQIGLVSGHKADFSVMVMDPDPLRVESVHQNLLATQLGAALELSLIHI